MFVKMISLLVVQQIDIQYLKEGTISLNLTKKKK